MKEDQIQATPAPNNLHAKSDTMDLLGQRKIETTAAVNPYPFNEDYPVLVPSNRVGKFRLDKLIGRGGMGNVYLAYDEQLRRKVAIKFPRVDTFHKPQVAKQFLHEARLAAQLNHPNLVKIHEIEFTNELCFIASEWCDGGDLAGWIAEHGGCRHPRWCAKLVLLITRAVAHCHSQNIVHLDIKPANIMLTKHTSNDALDLEHSIEAGTETLLDAINKLPSDEAVLNRPLVVERLRPMLTDFGVARVVETGITRTHTSLVMGTPLYMAPEQAEGDRSRIGPASDVFALGVVLHELLFGEHPFNGETPLQVFQQLRGADTLVIPKRDHVPQDLRTICQRCLQHLPDQRYDSAQELADELSRFLQGEPIRAKPVSMLQYFQRWCSRPQRISDAVTTVLVSQTGIALWTILGAIVAGKLVSGDELDSSRLQFLSTVAFMSLPVVALQRFVARGKRWPIIASLVIVFFGQTLVPLAALLGAINIMGAVYDAFPFFRLTNLGLVFIFGLTQSVMLALALAADCKRCRLL